jgi:hypothetical protein
VIAREAGHVLCLNYTMLCHARSSEFVQGDYLSKMYGEKVKFVTHNH